MVQRWKSVFRRNTKLLDATGRKARADVLSARYMFYRVGYTTADARSKLLWRVKLRVYAGSTSTEMTKWRLFYNFATPFAGKSIDVIVDPNDPAKLKVDLAEDDRRLRAGQTGVGPAGTRITGTPQGARVVFIEDQPAQEGPKQER